MNEKSNQLPKRKIIDSSKDFRKEKIWNIINYFLLFIFVYISLNNSIINLDYTKVIAKVGELDIAISSTMLGLEVTIFTFFISYDSKLGNMIKKSIPTFNSIKKRLYIAINWNIVNLCFGIIATFLQFNVKCLEDKIEICIIWVSIILLFTALLFSFRFIYTLLSLLISSYLKI